MTMKLRHSFITSIVAGSLFCTLLTGVSPAMAAEASDVPTSTQDRLQELGAAAAEWVSVSDAQTAHMVRTWEVEHGRSSSGLAIDPEEAKAFTTVDGPVLRIPFATTTGVLPESGVSAVFDRDGRVAGTSELVLTPRSADSGRVRTWTDGVLRVDRIVTDSDATFETRSTWWSRFSNCLNSKGVAAWAVTALTIACSAICIASIGTLCLACLAAASGITSGTISYCIAKASRG